MEPYFMYIIITGVHDQGYKRQGNSNLQGRWSYLQAIVDRRKPEVAVKTKSHQAALTARVQQLQVSYHLRSIIYTWYYLPEFTKALKASESSCTNAL